MRRAVPAAIIVLLGASALVSFQSTPGSPAVRSAAGIAVPRTTSPPITAPPPPDTDTPPTATTPTTIPGTTPTTTPVGPRTVTGDAVDSRYGVVQVQVTLQGTTITDVVALQMPNSHQRSVEISQQAEPLLKQEALQAQSAEIDALSGATFTSDGYAQSLQSVLDRACA